MLDNETKADIKYLTLLKQKEQIEKEIEDIKAQQTVSKDYSDGGIPKSIFNDAEDKESKLRELSQYFKN